MSICDVCNQPAGSGSKQYPADQMRMVVRAGFRPPKSTTDAMAAMNKMLGIPEESFINQWINQIMNDTTDWMLCRSCSAAAESALKNAKPAGLCAFCKQPIYPSDQVAMIPETALAELISLGAVLPPGPPSGKDKMGVPRWVACLKCMNDINKRAERLMGK